MNSAVMPAEGCYNLRKITRQQYAAEVRAAIESGNYSSSVGYPDNVRIIEQLTGYTVPVSREETNLQKGDTLLIMKLRYRTDGYKQQKVSLDDFEFFRAEYK